MQLDLAIFPGQGVLVQGNYGVITKVWEEPWIRRDEVPPKAKVVDVMFQHGKFTVTAPVPVKHLQRPVMPKDELEKIYAKYYPELLGEEQ